MAAITQYGPHGVPMRRYGSFVGKTADAGGAHPVGKITQYGPHGVPMRRYGLFSGKEASSGGGAHPVGILTQYGPWGVPMRRYGSFAGKQLAEAVAHSQHNVQIAHNMARSRRHRR